MKNKAEERAYGRQDSGSMVVLVGAAAVAINKFVHSEKGQNIIKGLEMLGDVAYKSTLLMGNDGPVNCNIKTIKEGASPLLLSKHQL